MTNDVETRALIITWNGEALPDYIVGKIMDAVRMNACGGNEASICAKQYDGDDLSALLVKQQSVNRITLEMEPVEAALKYIGKRYSSNLSDQTSFAIALMRDIAIKEVYNAVEILSTKDIKGAQAREYGISRNNLNTILSVYRSYKA